MTNINVKPTANGYRLSTDDGAGYDCIIGKAGLIAADDKCEGDMATPLGTWAMRCLYYRPDRLPTPQSQLATYPITPDLGWCDDPNDKAYNQLVRHPYPGRYESLWRDDHRYDLLVVLGHNDAPPIAGMGSAIFFHLCDENTYFTAGCVAVFKDHMIKILASLGPTSTMRIIG